MEAAAPTGELEISSSWSIGLLLADCCLLVDSSVEGFALLSLCCSIEEVLVLNLSMMLAADERATMPQELARPGSIRRSFLYV